jgi:hypothetical protein
MTQSASRRTAGRLTAAALTVLLSGCAAAPPDIAPIALPAELSHIHALVADPAGGGLLVATHEGIFTWSPADGAGPAVSGPLGGNDLDPMGLTLDAGAAYASGHPGPATPAELGGPSLGLIRSDDGGLSWRTLSLGGEVDFHALSVGPTSGPGPGPIYGLDSAGTVRVSADGGHTWREGASVAARVILADPMVPDRLYATTAAGLAVSADGGASFAVDTTAPELFLIAADGDAMAGVDTTGTLWQRLPAGGWESGGTVAGTPQALLVDGTRLYVADDRGIAFTDDLGGTWIAPGGAL